MNRNRIGGIGALALAGVVVVLAVTPLGGAAVRHVSQLIAPTSKSAVANVNAFVNWTPSTFSRDGFSQVTHPGIPGVYCLTGRANPDKSMLLLTLDAQHSLVGGGSAYWDRSAPDCASGDYEVVTYCPFSDGGIEAPTPRLPEGFLCNDIAFFAEAFVR
jgi:hypothetical protein